VRLAGLLDSPHAAALDEYAPTELPLGGGGNLAPCASFHSPHSCRWVRQCAFSRYCLGRWLPDFPKITIRDRPLLLLPLQLYSLLTPHHQVNNQNVLAQSTPHAHHYLERIRYVVFRGVWEAKQIIPQPHRCCSIVG
jgi:hypothetical protein